MDFPKTLLTLTLISFATLPALAAKKQTFTCESSVDANGNVIYLPVKPAKTAAKQKVRHRRMVKRVHQDETKSVAAAPVTTTPAEPAPAVTEAPPVAQERAKERQSWLTRHMVTKPIYGNMSGWAGRSTISYLHGTDNPFGKIALNSDEGPSALKYRHTATEDQGGSF